MYNKNPANYISVIWQACIHNDIEKVADSTTKISILVTLVVTVMTAYMYNPYESVGVLRLW
jgi:hypothetical protein